MQDGITFSGGDPFVQPEACAEIAEAAKKIKLSTWCYTGYTWEQLLKMREVNQGVKKFMDNLDVIIDRKIHISRKKL